jgi:hypothetical protein
VGEAEVLDELLIGGRLLKGVEVLAVEVLDQRLLEGPGVVGHPHKGGDGLQAGPSCRPPPTLSRDELEVPLAELSDQHGLQDADLPDAGGQGGQGLFVEVLPGLPPVGLDACHRELLELRALLAHDLGGDEGAKALT